jgi:hypothetical protein
LHFGQNLFQQSFIYYAHLSVAGENGPELAALAALAKSG